MGFSLFPIMLLSVPLLSLMPRDSATTYYLGFSIAIVTISLQILGFILGVIGIARGPKRIVSSVGALVCFLFGLAAIATIIK
jgi:hypothetical protein